MLPRKSNPLTQEGVNKIWDLFGSPPVLKTEDREAYDNIRQGYVAFYRPTTSLHVSLIRELVDTEWEMFRLFRIRTKILNRTYRRTDDSERMNLLERPFWNIRDIDNGVDLLDRLDKWLNTATVRRNNLLKLVEYYCPTPDDDTSIPEAEFKKVDQNETKQIAAPPVAPTEGTANDVAMQNSSEQGTASDVVTQNSGEQTTASDVVTQNQSEQGSGNDVVTQNSSEQGTANDVATQNQSEQGSGNDVATQNSSEPVERAKE
jgi:hypothetical protein